MAVQLLACPLCSQPGFATLDSLRDGLVSAASRQLNCPVCHDVLLGLDKLTIHLFGHCAQNNLSLDLAARPTKPSRPVDTFVRNDLRACATKPPANGTERPVDSFARSDRRNNPGACSATKPLAVETERTFEGPAEVDGSFVRRSSTVGLPTICVVSTRGAEANANASTEAPCVPNPRGPTRAVEEIRTVENTRCDTCGIPFVDPKVLLMHKQLVHAPVEPGGPERKNFGCFLCSKVFKMRGSLMVHLRVAHGASNIGRTLDGGGAEPQERPVVCNTCGKSFTKEQHLNQHVKTHEEKQWACDVCQKMFTTKYFLKKHKRLHTGEMPYSCNICHKAFTFQQSMHKHALYHSNDKPHSCPDCHRTFKELSTLTNHRRIHTGEKPFSCETCGKCFRQRVSYLVHRRIHTGVMPYQCTACGKSFRYKVSERSHKCPSQPPGVIVRQAGELLQKLQVKVAAHASSQLAPDGVRRPTGEPTLPGPPSSLGLFQRTNHLAANEITREHPGNAASQFIIIVDNITNSGNVLVAPSAVDKLLTTTGIDWCQRPNAPEVHPWAEEPKSEGTPDFFSVLEDLPSPSEGLRNLTISPSLKRQGMEEFSFQDCPTSSDRSPDVLQTINEESLKQLLYGTSLGGT